MASLAGARDGGVHATLSGTTADTITFTAANAVGGVAGGGATLAVTNRDTSVTLYFTTTGTAAVSAATGTYVVLPLQTKTVIFTGHTVVSVVGNGNAYSVELI